MKIFSDRHAPVNDSQRERLGDIVGVDVVYSLEAQVWENQFFTASQSLEYPGIKMARWIQRFPAGSDDMPRMQNRGGKSPEMCLPPQMLFDLRYSGDRR